MATPPARPRAIFFDLDETLIVNSVSVDQWIDVLFAAHLSSLEPALKDVFRRAVFDAADGLWERMLTAGEQGRTLLVNAFRHAIKQVGGDTNRAESMFDLFLRTSVGGTQLSPNAMTVLRSLRSMGLATGIITNGLEALQRAKIRRHGLESVAQVIVISEIAGAHKPSRVVFEQALALASVEAHEAWHVGDHRLNDVAGAIATGMTAVLYEPIRPRSNREAGTGTPAPNHTIRDLGDLLPLIPPPTAPR